MEGQLKGVIAKADKERALKQVAKATLNSKVLKLATTEWSATTVKRARELAKQKMEDLQGKLAEAVSIVTAYDKELANLKETIKMCEQVFYNMGFKDTENLA